MMSFAPHRVAHLQRERTHATIERILAVLAYLNDCPVSSAAEVHRAVRVDYKCCLRSVQRDLKLLCDVGLVEATQGFFDRQRSRTITYETTGRVRVSIESEQEATSCS